MKTTLKYFSIILFSLSSLSAYSQLTDTTMLVNGVCEMCEFTIEKAAFVEGVSEAEWNVETKVLAVSYDAEVTNLQAISDAINASGYDTEYNTAPEEAYLSLHKCCYYRDPEVVKDHEKK